jgi:uncharacterized protein (DUF302 family)
VVTKVSPRSVSETVARFTDLLSAKGVRLFAVIDQADEARQVGLELRETVLVLFGNPKAGTPVMVASPLAALDLPLKVVVWGRRAANHGLLPGNQRAGGSPSSQPGAGRQPRRHR